MATWRFEPQVSRQIHFAHAASPDGGHDLVRAEAETGGKQQRVVVWIIRGRASSPSACRSTSDRRRE